MIPWLPEDVVAFPHSLSSAVRKKKKKIEIVIRKTRQTFTESDGERGYC